jgi:predicted esterase
MAPKSAYTDGFHGPNSTLPTILCLHGGGTNAAIFNVQSIRIQRALADTFHFIFLEGPVIALPGPGVLPVFDGCEPFLRWATPEAGPIPKETVEIIRAAIKERQKKAEVVGVMGFSQGAKLAAGLLMEQQLREKGREGEGLGAEFKFGVLFNSTTPPYANELLENELIAVPSLHVVGKTDPWRKSSVGLYEEYFDKMTGKKIELDVGHRLPNLPDDTDKIVAEIRRLHQETMGSAKGASDQATS